MFRKRLKNEAGYSLVEVMVSIIILVIGIIPLVGMFDMGLHSATTGSNYDKARALANLKMEEAKSLTFAEVEGNFPQGVGNTTPYTTVNPINGPGGFTGFQYKVEKDYMTQPPTGQGGPIDPTQTFTESGTATGLIRVTVIVLWGDGKTYTTYGLVGQ